MYYYNREDQDAAARAYIDDYRKAAALYPIIKKVFREFDKKVFNKRLEAALQDQTGARVFVTKELDWLDVHVLDHRCNRITLARLHKNDLIDGKRIDAEKFTESLTNARNAYLKKAADYEKQIEEIDSTRLKIAELKRQLESLLEPFDYTIRDIYGINVHLR